MLLSWMFMYSDFRTQPYVLLLVGTFVNYIYSFVHNWRRVHIMMCCVHPILLCAWVLEISGYDKSYLYWSIEKFTHISIIQRVKICQTCMISRWWNLGPTLWCWWYSPLNPGPQSYCFIEQILSPLKEKVVCEAFTNGVGSADSRFMLFNCFLLKMSYFAILVNSFSICWS